MQASLKWADTQTSYKRVLV